MSNNLPSRPERPTGKTQGRASETPKRKLPTGNSARKPMPTKPDTKGSNNSRQSPTSNPLSKDEEGLKKKAPTRPKPNVTAPARPRPSQRIAQPKKVQEEAQRAAEDIERTSPSTPARREYIEEHPYEPPVEQEYYGEDAREPRFDQEVASPEGFEFEEPKDINEDNTEYLNEGNYAQDEEPEYDPFHLKDEETEIAPRAKEKNRKKKKPPKQKTAQEKFSNQGARRNNLIIRGLILTVVLVVVGMNIKVVFFPQSVPSPDQVVSVVNESNGDFGFPTGEGTTFVQEFATAYLNVKRDDDVDAETVLEKYVSDSSVDSIVASIGGIDNSQKVTKGPFVSSKVEEIDENNANYTISAQLNGSSWIYLLVPVYAEPEDNSFVVSGSPSFVSPPATAKYSPPNETRSTDDELSSKVEPDINNFFKAWASSDSTSLTRLISPEATTPAKLGLRNAVELEDVISIDIFEAAGNDEDVREGVVQVSWVSTKSKDEEESGISYKQSYNITIEKRDTRWYIQDISGAGQISD